MVLINQHQLRKEIFENPIFNIHLGAMRLAGLFIGNNQGYQLLHFARCIFVAVSILISSYRVIAGVLRNIDDLNVDTMEKPVACILLSLSIWIVNVFLRRKRIFKLINFTHDDLLVLRSYHDDVEDRLYNNTIKYLHRLTYFMWTPVLISCISDIVSHIKHLFFSPGTEPQLSYLMKSLLLVTRVFITIIMSNVLPIWHTFVVSLIKYVIFKIDLASKRLSEMDFTKLDSRLKSKEDLDELNELDRNHWRQKMCEHFVKEQITIRWSVTFVHELQELIYIPVLLDFLIMSFLVCFILYLLTVGTSEDRDNVHLVLYIFIVTVRLWLYYWHASLVTDSHAAMCFAIYSCNWYDFPLHLQKTIRLLMMESSKPLVLRAIILDMNMNTFVDIERAAFSYYNIVRNLNLK